MAERGYYSLIQYVPDVSRAEGANVGVVIVCPRLGSVAVRMAKNNEGPRQRFGATTFDAARLSHAMTALQNRIYSELSRSPTVAALEKVRVVEGNALALTPPRTVAVDNVDRVADELHEQLVYLPERSRDRARIPNLKPLLRFLRVRNVPVHWRKSITVPVTEETLRVAFEYTNGSRNYVHAHGFSGSKELAVDQAQRVGTIGRLLHLHPDGGQRNKLIVVARFSEPRHSGLLEQLLADMNVRVIPEAGIHEFGQEVYTTARSVDAG